MPSNFPLLLLMLKFAPALIAGNVVIAKPAPTTPLTTLLLGESAASILPAGVFQTIVDANDLGPLLTSHAGIAHVSFTGRPGRHGLDFRSNARGSCRPAHRKRHRLGQPPSALPCDVPFGGAKQSGIGRQQGIEGLKEFTQARIVNINLKASADPGLSI